MLSLSTYCTHVLCCCSRHDGRNMYCPIHPAANEPVRGLVCIQRTPARRLSQPKKAEQRSASTKVQIRPIAQSKVRRIPPYRRQPSCNITRPHRPHPTSPPTPTTGPRTPRRSHTRNTEIRIPRQEHILPLPLHRRRRRPAATILTPIRPPIRINRPLRNRSKMGSLARAFAAAASRRGALVVV